VDESEGDEPEEDHIEFVETGEHAPVAFQSAEQPFYFVAFLCTSAGRTPKGSRQVLKGGTTGTNPRFRAS